MQVTTVLALLLTCCSLSSVAIGAGFDGNWVIDTRSEAEKKQPDLSCGTASFELNQMGQDIVGIHSNYPSGCGRINEGGSVVGVAKGSTAILYVTSGRNGAIFKGKAKLKNDSLYWVILKEIKAGDIEGDSPLVLSKGILHREKSKP